MELLKVLAPPNKLELLALQGEIPPSVLLNFGHSPQEKNATWITTNEVDSNGPRVNEKMFRCQ